MKTLDKNSEREFQVGKNIDEDVFSPEKESDSGDCDYYYKCGSNLMRGCSHDEREISEKDSQSQEKRNLGEGKNKFNEFGEYLCGCDSGKCFDCGI